MLGSDSQATENSTVTYLRFQFMSICSMLTAEKIGKHKTRAQMMTNVKKLDYLSQGAWIPWCGCGLENLQSS